MIKLLWSGFIILCMVSGCGYNGTPTRHNDFAPLTSIKIVAAVPAIETSHTIAALTSTNLTVIGDFSGQFTRDITDQAVWSSGSPAVADFKFTTVPNKNRVTGIAQGSAILTATVGSVKSADYPLTVSNAAVTAMTISTVPPTVSPATPTVPNGLTKQFAVSGTFSDSTTQDLTFDATWSSTPGTFATISNDPASKGLAQAIAVGTETITASFGTIPTTATTTLTVTAPMLQSITVTPPNSSVAGFPKTVNFIATGTYSDKTTRDITTTVTWSSSVTGVATINASSGVATTVAVGTTSISASATNSSGTVISGSTNLTVTTLALNANGLQIAPVGPIFLSIGATQPLTVTATFTDGSTQNVTSSSQWTSTFPTIAAVNTSGSVTGVATGSSTISASFGGQSVAVNVTVQ